MRSVVLAVIGLAVICGPANAELRVRVMKGSAIGMPSTFERTPGAPRSTFEKAGPDSSLTSVFVPSEVEPGRVETTRTLLTELNARRTEGSIVLDLPTDVLFDFDKAVIRSEAAPALAKAAEVLKSYPTAKVTIGGHTDSKGDETYNNALSLRRAKAVADRLSGPAGRPLAAEGFGETRPVAPNAHPDGSDDPDGRQKNRRVEIRITPPSA